MRRIVATSMIGLLSSGMAFAQSATCEDQAAYVIENVPGVVEQAEIETPADYMAYDARLLLSIVTYSAAADVLGERAVDRGLPREYWLGLLVVSDGLVRCFEDATNELTDEQLASTERFFEIYTADIRNQFASQAMAELGMFGDDQ